MVLNVVVSLSLEHPHYVVVKVLVVEVYSQDHRILLDREDMIVYFDKCNHQNLFITLQRGSFKLCYFDDLLEAL